MSKEITPEGDIKPSESASQEKASAKGRNSQDNKDSSKTTDPLKKESKAKIQPDEQPKGKKLSQSTPLTKKPNETNLNVQSKSSKRKKKRNANPARPSPIPDSKKLQVCHNFLKYKCRRGQHCEFLHMNPSKIPKMDDLPLDPAIPSLFQDRINVCRDFIHNMCPNSNNCIFYHPPLEINDGAAESMAWFAICRESLSDSCTNSKCRSVSSHQQQRISAHCHHHSLSSSIHSIQCSVIPVHTIPYVQCSTYIGLCPSNFCLCICIHSPSASSLTFLSSTCPSLSLFLTQAPQSYSHTPFVNSLTFIASTYTNYFIIIKFHPL